MKKITKLAIAMLLMSISNALIAQETCTANATFIYYTTNGGWTQSEWYQIISIDAENLGTNSMASHTGVDGVATSTAFSTGSFTTPIYSYNETTQAYEPTSVLWPVNYYLACLAPLHYTSARAKINNGASVSGTGTTVTCTLNDNTVKTSPIWDKKGFIELSRQGSEVASTPPSRHGYIELNDLPQVERVQYSFSSTSWKRGFKLDIKHGNGEWQPLRWEANNVNNIVTFAEQGYAFEEIIGKQEDPTSKISLRWRIWDGDSIHVNPVSSTGATFTTVNTPYAAQQVVRIHQIKVYSGVVPTSAPNAVQTPQYESIKVYLSEKNIILSEIANVEVYSYDGKRVFKGISDKIDVSSFTRGVYIVKAISASGKAQTKIVL